MSLRPAMPRPWPLLSNLSLWVPPYLLVSVSLLVREEREKGKTGRDGLPQRTRASLTSCRSSLVNQWFNILPSALLKIYKQTCGPLRFPRWTWASWRSSSRGLFYTFVSTWWSCLPLSESARRWSWPVWATCLTGCRRCENRLTFYLPACCSSGTVCGGGAPRSHPRPRSPAPPTLLAERSEISYEF